MKLLKCTKYATGNKTVKPGAALKFRAAIIFKPMKCIIFTKQGAETIDTTAPTPKKGKVYNWLVNYFNNWINNQPRETQQMYFGSFEELEGESYFSAKGAISEMYYTLCEYIEENELKTLTSNQFNQIDFDGVIQP